MTYMSQSSDVALSLKECFMNVIFWDYESEVFNDIPLNK